MSSETAHYDTPPSDLDFSLCTDNTEQHRVQVKANLGARLAKTALRAVLQEYLTASAYFRSIGAQTPSSEYGGSRSMIYMQMLDGAHTLRELRGVRSDYKGRHSDPAANHDEYGGCSALPHTV